MERGIPVDVQNCIDLWSRPQEFTDTWYYEDDLVAALRDLNLESYDETFKPWRPQTTLEIGQNMPIIIQYCAEVTESVWNDQSERIAIASKWVSEVSPSERMSRFMKPYLDANTEEGRQRRAEMSARTTRRYDPTTVEGVQYRQLTSQRNRERYDINTETGRALRKRTGEISAALYDINTQEGRDRRKATSDKGREVRDPNTERGLEIRRRHGAGSLAANNRKRNTMGLTAGYKCLHCDNLVSDPKAWTVHMEKQHNVLNADVKLGSYVFEDGSSCSVTRVVFPCPVDGCTWERANHRIKTTTEHMRRAHDMRSYTGSNRPVAQIRSSK